MSRSRAVPVLPVLAALVALRAALVFVPGTWVWSLQTQRFVAPVLGWTLWSLAALSLLPGFARLQAAPFAAIGHGLDSAPRRVGAVLALAVAGLVFAMPDQTWFTGDFLLRVGLLDPRTNLAHIAPQSLPLDLWLHVSVPRALAAAGWLANPADAARVLGALEAAAVTGVALAFAADAGWTGVARVTFAAVALGGSALTLMAGYGKTSGELALCAVLALLLARRLAGEAKGGAALGIVLALALASHRSALLLVPVWAIAWGLSLRSRRRPAMLAAAIGIGAPLVVLIALAPRLVGLLVQFDLPRHLLGHSAGSLDWRTAWLDPIQLLDRLNVALAYAPLAPLLLLPGAALAADDSATGDADQDARKRVRLVDHAAVWPGLAMGLLIQPQQGLFRDWDVFVIPGTWLALAVAGRAARWIGSGRDGAVRVAPVFWIAILAGGLWLVVGHDSRAGLARVRAFAEESPDRGDARRGKLWEFLGDRAAELRRWDDAAVALREAVKTQPSPRLFTMLSMAEAELGNVEAAQVALERAARKDPSIVSSWASWLLLAIQRGDESAIREAAEGLRRIAPDHPLLARMRADSLAKARASAPAR